MTKQLERLILDLVASDRIGIPIKSMSGKIDRMKPKLVKAISLPKDVFSGERVHAKFANEEGTKARGMKKGIEAFSKAYPQHGKILHGLIAEQRINREPTLYFGVNDGCRLTADDYMNVMTNLGLTETKAQTLYPILMEVSRNISRKRDEERSILIG